MSANLNTTVNETQPSTCINPTAEKIGKTFAYVLLSVVSLAGNTFIGILIYKTKAMRKPINFLIVNMAMSDLMFPIVLFPYLLNSLYADFWLVDGPLGKALCKIFAFLADVSSVVSIQSMVLIAVDRFRAVVFPLRSPLISSKLCPFFILATWIVAMVFRSPYLFAFKLVKYPEGLKCALQWKEAFGETSSFDDFTTATFIIILCVPLVLIAILYLAILLKLRFQTIPGEQSVNAGEQRLKRERNVLKMSIAIVLAFALCWLPRTIRWFLYSSTSDSTMISSCGFHYFTSIAIFLAQSNCAVNPCICFVFSGNYRQGLKNLLSCFSVNHKTAPQPRPPKIVKDEKV